MTPTRSLALASFAAVVLSSTVALATPPPHAPIRSVVRFDVSISGVDAAPVTFTITLEENANGALSTGANVPLTTGGASPAAVRQDVGLSLHLSYTLRGNAVVVDGAVELSSVDSTGPAGAAATIHRVRADGAAVITPGTPALLASVYDLTSHHRYEVTISATRLL